MEKRKKHTLKHGNTVIHVIEPLPMSREETEKVLADFHKAGWAIVRDLNAESTDHGRHQTPAKPKGI